MFNRSCMVDIRALEAFLYRGPEPISKRPHPSLTKLEKIAKETKVEERKVWYRLVYDAINKKITRVFYD